MSDKELKKYNLYEDIRREAIAITNEIIKICKENLPSKWEMIKFWFRINWCKEYTFVVLAVLSFIAGLIVHVIWKPKPPALPQLPTLEEKLVHTLSKPGITNIVFYRDGDLMICEADIVMPQRTYTVVASFIDENGQQVSQHDQQVVFNEVRRVRFLSPYFPRVKKVKLYVK